MRRVFLCMTMVAAIFFHASTALAGGLNLAWDHCASDGGLQVKVSACLTNAANNILIGSFVPVDDLAGVTGIKCVLDVLIGDGTSPIPPWWDMVGIGACRATSPQALIVTGVPLGPAIYCTDWASGLAGGGLAAYQIGGNVPPANAIAHRRMVIGFAVSTASAADLLSTQEYFGFNVIISNTKTVGTGSCAGCLTPACIVFNSLNIVPGVSQGQRVQVGTSAGSNFATWQTSAPNCALVPTRRTTWSAVKQLYH